MVATPASAETVRDAASPSPNTLTQPHINRKNGGGMPSRLAVWRTTSTSPPDVASVVSHSSYQRLCAPSPRT